LRPRRTIIDTLLAEAAARDGAEVRQGFDVGEVVLGDGDGVVLRGRARGGKAATERARMVIGADGRRSIVAKAVEAHQYNERPPLCSVYYASLTLVVAGWPDDEFKANRGDIEGTFLRALDLEPAFAARVRAGTRETRFWGAGDLRGFFRTPYGPGWGLVGDAGHHKHPITAMGMTTPSSTPSASPAPWTTGCQAADRSTTRWATITGPATNRRWPCTS
jgi:flavin-dependent dehydrogenase